jgi:hypothetical protein
MQLPGLQTSSNKHVISFTVFVALILSVDYLISNTADILQLYITSDFGIYGFIILTVCSIFAQFYYMRFIKDQESSVLEKAILILQSVINSILVFIIIEIALFQKYESILLLAIMSLSYLISIFLTGYLAVKFLQWLKINKHYIVFFYFIAVTMFCFNGIVTLVFSDVLILDKTEIITADLPVIFDIGFESASIMSLISSVQTISMNIYFIALWLGTIGILKFNIRKLGKMRFWIIVSLPLVYFVGYELTIYQYIYPNNPVTSSISSNFLYSILIYTSSFIICGILFGTSFFIITKYVKNKILEKYLVTTGIGFVIFFISGTATLIQAAYPPFGAPSIAFLGIASYFIFVGLYKSALSISHDYALLKAIEHSILKDSALLNLIGRSQFELEAQKKVKKVTEKFKDMYEDYEVDTEMSKEDVRNHIEFILEELKEKRNTNP